MQDVIISGAGPVGLFLACELALAKCSVLILEKAERTESPLKKIPFGMRGLSTPTIEALYRRGLLEELTIHRQIKNPHQNAGQGSARQVGHFAGIPFREGDIDTSGWPHPPPDSNAYSLISEMQELETVLTRRAEALGVKICRGMAVTDFHQDKDGVTVLSGERSFQSKWLAGCDGSRSIIRRKAGFEFAGTEPECTGYSTLVDMADPEKLKPGRNLTAKGMYLQSRPGYLIIQDFDGGAFHHSKMPITREHVQEVLRRVSETDVTIKALHIATTWTDRARQTTAYREERVLLAGDAAHIHSPLGGQGLNLGLGDALNLGWKLAASLRGKAPENLLDSYFAERYPMGARVLDWSRAQVAIMKTDPAARALNAIVRDLLTTRDGATYFAGRVWGIDAHYAGGEHVLVGHSVPDFELEGGKRIAARLQEGLGILLEFGAGSSLNMLADEYGGQITYVSGQSKGKSDLSAVLVRPDGFVAWASDGTPDLAGLRQALDRWFVR